MKILVINCSPVRNGATAEIVNIVSSYMEKENEVKSICIDDYNIQFCKGCRTCHQDVYKRQNMGCAQAKLFLFEKAAVSFEQASRLGGDPDSLLSYLAAMRLHLKEQEYLNFLTEHPEYYETSLELEKLVVERKAVSYTHLDVYKRQPQTVTVTVFQAKPPSGALRNCTKTS